MTLKQFSYEEVAKNTSKKSAWATINGFVYDLTEFLEDHPGGADIILDALRDAKGADITTTMKDPKIHSHSDTAFDLLSPFQIGSILDEGIALDSETSSDDDVAAAASGPALSTSSASSGSSKSGIRSRGGAAAAKADSKSADSKGVEFLALRDDASFLDLSKPLWPQMWNNKFTRSHYLTQVHIPRYLPQPALLFGNALEPLSRTYWWIVPTIWVPFVSILTYIAICAAPESAYTTIPFSFVFGMFLWTLVEYAIHRFLFHLDELLPDHPKAFAFHFILHGIHHYLPMDGLRLVMPPAMAIILMIPLWTLVRSLSPSLPIAQVVFAGGVFGYILYDLTHYYLHHGRPLTAHLREMKRYHVDHHYKNFHLGYGITSKIWDYVFSTVLV